MSRRNLILLIIVLIILSVAVIGYLYSRTPEPAAPGEDTGTNFFSRFNPFGKSGGNSAPTPTPDTPEPNIPTPDEVAAVKLKKVSTLPIAGYIVFQKERLKEVPLVPAEEQTPPASPTKPKAPLTEFAPAIRYVERVTGNVYANWADKIDGYRFTSTEIPKVYEAYFGTKGDAVFMRYLKSDGKTIQTYFGLMPKELLGADKSGNSQVKGSFLPEGIGDMSISPDTAKAFYLFNSGDGVAGVVLDIAGNKKTQVFDSPFTEWITSWPSAKLITLTTKASGAVPGYMYAINPDRKDSAFILGGVSGLTTLTSPSGKLVLYTDSNLSLNIYNIDTKTASALALRTLPEKCVWGAGSDVIYCAVPKATPPGSYPDGWYQGEVSFNDQIWKIDVASGNTTLLIDPLALGEEIDGIKLALDEKGAYLLFINKKDSILWELELK